MASQPIDHQAKNGWRRVLLLVLVFTLIAVMLKLATDAFHRATLRHNEASAVAACKAFAEAQEIYHRNDWDGDGVLEYAQSLQNLIDRYKPGDGLVQCIDRAFANAEALANNPTPKNGYLLKILHSRLVGGKSLSYISPEGMTGGYALVAFPAHYGVTGNFSYAISNTGTIYQIDLGPDTAAVVKNMTTFDIFDIIERLGGSGKWPDHGE